MKFRCLFPVFLAVSSVMLCGCGYGTKSDISNLQVSIDLLTKQVYQLEQRVNDLETAIANTPSPSPVIRPASTPAPAAAPRFFNMTADGICSALLKNGMPVISFKRYTSKDDPDGLLGTNAGYTSRADFKDKNVADAMGIIEVYASAKDAQMRLSAMEFELARSGGSLDGTQVFLYDNVMMRLPEAFSIEQGMQYEDALRKILGLTG